MDTKYLISNTWYQILNIQYLILDICSIYNLKSDPWYLILHILIHDILRLKYDTGYLIFEIRMIIYGILYFRVLQKIIFLTWILIILAILHQLIGHSKIQWWTRTFIAWWDWDFWIIVSTFEINVKFWDWDLALRVWK